MNKLVNKFDNKNCSDERECGESAHKHAHACTPATPVGAHGIEREKTSL